MEYKSLTPLAQKLRRNMTKEERHLWYDFIKSLPHSFKRQHPIGSYIVDFYCPAQKLAIELDGSQHFEEPGIKKDTIRTQDLSEFGITVLRYTNWEINNLFDGVCEDILRHIDPKFDELE